MELLRFTTAGSVDDGKSTLIGRLLYDTKSVYSDQLESIESASKRKGLSYRDLSLLTDGLKDEREQGITIDVAYRYVDSPKRKFIIADTPGHIQYTRNMVTGASTANLALITVDVRNGVVEQTKRHAFLASLLKIPHVVLCVNKMDLVDFSEAAFESVVNDFKSFASKLSMYDLRFIPISALHGDNVVHSSERMPWYKGGTLLNTLETVHVGSDENHIDCRFPVQTVIRPKTEQHPDYRAYAGRIASGVFKPGDRISVLPSGFQTRITHIHCGNKAVSEAFAPLSVSMQLEDDLDIGRGDMLVRTNNQPQMLQDVECMLCWLDGESLNPNATYIVRHTTNEARCRIVDIAYKLNINTLHRNEDDRDIGMNDIARVRIRTTKPLYVDSYAQNRHTGSIIIIDAHTHNTVAAGMIL